MEIFKLFGSILVDSGEAESSIHKTESKAKTLGATLGNGIKTAAKWGAGLVAGASAAGAAMLGVANKAAESADEIDKMSQKIGLSKESYQEWKYAMSQSGIDISVMQTGVKTLTGLMDRASEGNEAAAATFEALGLSIYDSSGQLKSQEVMMQEAIMTLASMEDNTERAKLATELFGKAGVELEPLLNSGAEGIQDLMDRAHELGLVMSDEAVTAGVTFGDTMADVKDSLGMVGAELGTALMPILQDLLSWVVAHLPEIKEIASKVIDGVKVAIAAFQEFWAEHGEKITKKIQSVMKIISDVVRGVVDAVLALIEGDWSAAWDALVGIVMNVGPALLNAGKSIINFLWDGIKSVWSDISGWISEKVGWLVDKLTFWDNGTKQIEKSGFSHASGLAYVPYDNYPINAHRGEMLLNARDAGTLLNAIQTMSGGSAASKPQEIVINITESIDGATLARNQYRYNAREGNLRGGSLVEVGR